MTNPKDQNQQDIREQEFNLRIFVDALKKKFYILILIIVGGLIVGGLYHFIKTPIYKATFPAFSPVINNYHAEDLVNNMQTIIEKGEASLIKEKIGISSKRAKQLQRIEFQFNQEDKQYFTIEAFLLTPDAVNAAQHAIEYYFRQNPYNAKLIDLKKRNLQKQILSANEQLNSLDSIKNSLHRLVETQKNNSTRNILSYPSNFHLEKLRILEKRANYQEKLDKLAAINFYQKPFVPSEPTYPNTRLVFGIALLLSLLMGLLVVIFLAYIDQYRD
jgi:hypothetical protein